MRLKILILPALFFFVLTAIGCPPKPPVTDTEPEHQEPVVVDTFPENPISAAPDSTHFTEQNFPDDICGGNLNVTGKVVSMSPGLLTTSAHFILIFDAAFTKFRSGKPDMNSMRKTYMCFLENLLISGDRLSVIPYAYSSEGRFDRASWWSEVPLPDHRERVLGDRLDGEPVLGTWSWEWAVLDVIDRLNENSGINDPVIIISVSSVTEEESDSNDSEALEDILSPPNGLDKYIQQLTGGDIEPETIKFAYETLAESENSFESGEYTVKILMSEAAANLETDMEWASLRLSVENDRPIYMGDLVTFTLSMPERLQTAVVTGQAKVLWNSGGPVTGDIEPEGDMVKWVYQTAGGFRVEAAVVWSDGEESWIISDEIDITIEPDTVLPE